MPQYISEEELFQAPEIQYISEEELYATPQSEGTGVSGFLDNVMLGAETTGKGIVRGAIDVAQVPASLVDYAARALPEDAEKFVRGYAQKNIDALEAMKPEYDESVKEAEWYSPSGLNRSISEAVPTLAASFVPTFGAQKLASATSKGASYIDDMLRVKRAGRAAGVGSGIALESGMAHEEFLEYAKAHPDDPNVNAFNDFLATVPGGIMAGSLEGLSAMKLFTNAFGPKDAGKVLGNVATRALKGGVQGYLMEGSTEAAQEVIANSFKAIGYEPDQELTEGALRAFVVGGLVGGPMNAASAAYDTQEKSDARKAIALTRIESDLAEGRMTNEQLQQYAEQGRLDDFGITGDDVYRILTGDTEQTVDEVLQEYDTRKGAILNDLAADLDSGMKTVDDVLGYLDTAELHEFGVTDSDLYGLIGDEYRPGYKENQARNQTMEDLLREYDPEVPTGHLPLQDALLQNQEEVTEAQWQRRIQEENAAYDSYQPEAPYIPEEELYRKTRASSTYSPELAMQQKQTNERLMLPPGDTMTHNLGVMITPYDADLAAQRKRQRELLQLPETTNPNWQGILVPEEQRVQEYSPRHAAELKLVRETKALPMPTREGVLIPDEQRVQEYVPEHAAELKRIRDTKALPETTDPHWQGVLVPEEQRVQRYIPEHAAELKQARDTKALPMPTREGVLVPEDQRVQRYIPEHAAKLKQARETKALPVPTYGGVLVPEEQRVREYSPQHATELKQAREIKALPAPTHEGVIVPDEQRVREYIPQHAAELKQARETKVLPAPPRDFIITGRGIEEIQTDIDNIQKIPLKQRTKVDRSNLSALYKERKALLTNIQTAQGAAVQPTVQPTERRAPPAVKMRGIEEIQTDIDNIQKIPLKQRTKVDRSNLSALYREQRTVQKNIQEGVAVQPVEQPQMEKATSAKAPLEIAPFTLAQMPQVSVDQAAHEAATSKKNDRPQPTQAQIEAGNYKKGHTKAYGLGISIENPVGSVRKGVDQTGKKWQTKMADHYGYIKGTVGKDKDHLDVFIPEKFTEGVNDKVAVVDQIDPNTGKFDEHKIIFGTKSKKAALTTYLRNYDDTGRKNVGALTMMTVPEFKAWVASGKTKSPVGTLKTAPKLEAAKLETPTLTTPRRGEVGGKLASNEIVLTSSGRETTPFPRIDTSTNRKTGNTVKRVDAWLQQNAVEEARARGDRFNERIFASENPASIPPASKDAMEEYLFGEQPKVVPSILKDMTPKQPSVHPVKTEKQQRTVISQAMVDFAMATTPQEYSAVAQQFDAPTLHAIKEHLGWDDGSFSAVRKAIDTELTKKGEPTTIRDEKPAFDRMGVHDLAEEISSVDDFETARPFLEAMAVRVHQRGKTKLGPFKKAMTEALGDSAPKFKNKMVELFKYTTRILADETGAVGPDIRVAGSKPKKSNAKLQAEVVKAKTSLLDERLKSREYRKRLKHIPRYKALIEGLKNDHLDIHQKQALLTKHIRTQLPAYARGGEVLTSIKNISKFRTVEARQRALDRGLQMVDRMHDRVIAFESIEKVKKMLDKNKPSQVKGRPEGKAMPQVYPVLDGIRQVMNMSNKAVQEKSTALLAMIDREGREFSTETPAKPKGLSRLDRLSELEQYGILQIFGGLDKRAGADAKKAEAWLERFIEDGKAVYAANEEARLASVKQWRRIVVHEISGGKGIKSVAEENNSKTKNEEFFAKIKDSLSGFDSAHQSFEWLLDKLTNTESGVLKGAMTEHFGVLAHRATRSYDAGMIHYRETLANKVQEIYGMKGRKLEKILNRNAMTVENTGVHLRPVKLDQDGKPLKTEDGDFIHGDPVELHLTQNKAYKLWQALMDPDVANSLQVHGYTEETLSELEDFMDPRVKEWAEWQLYEFYPEYYQSVNEVYKRMFYVDLPFNAFYSPVSRDHGNVTEDDLLSGVQSHFGSVLNGSLMNRTSSNAAIKILDGDSVLERHIVQMEHFKAWAEPMREIRGVFQHRSVKKAIEQYADKSTLRILNRMMDDMARGGTDRANVLEALDHVRARFVKAVIGLNSVVFLKQLTSIPAYAMDIPVGSFVKGLFTFWKHPVRNWKLLNESQMVQNRYKVGFERDLILLNRKRTAAMLSGKTPWDDFIMFMVKMGDKAAIMTGGWSVYEHYYNTYKNQYKIVNGVKVPLMTEAEAKAKALENFEMTTERTQQAGNVKDLAHVQRIGGSFGKLFTMFMTAPNAYYRSVAGGWRNLIKGRGSKLENTKRIVFGHVILPAIFQLAANGLDWDNEDQLKAIMLGPFSGLIIARDLLGGALGALFDGYKAFDPDFTPVLSTAKDIMDAISAVTAGDMFEFMDEMASATGKLTGVPYDPVRRQVIGIHSSIEGATKNPIRRSLGFSASALGEDTKKKKAGAAIPF